MTSQTFSRNIIVLLIKEYILMFNLIFWNAFRLRWKRMLWNKIHNLLTFQLSLGWSMTFHTLIFYNLICICYTQVLLINFNSKSQKPVLWWLEITFKENFCNIISRRKSISEHYRTIFMKYALKSVGFQVIILEKTKKDLISIVCVQQSLQQIILMDVPFRCSINNVYKMT